MTLADGYPVAPADPMVGTIRYTTLEAVKDALRITDTRWDEQGTQAIIALESKIDEYVGGTFEAPNIPEAVKQAALVGGMEVWKIVDSPGGTGGSDSDGFIGMFDPAAAGYQAFNTVKPMLYGLRISWGTA